LVGFVTVVFFAVLFADAFVLAALMSSIATTNG